MTRPGAYRILMLVGLWTPRRGLPLLPLHRSTTLITGSERAKPQITTGHY
jgi:hypothetical protein